MTLQLLIPFDSDLATPALIPERLLGRISTKDTELKYPLKGLGLRTLLPRDYGIGTLKNRAGGDASELS
jgi:hypothetical protein